MSEVRDSVDTPVLAANTFVHTDECRSAQRAFEMLIAMGPLVGGLCLLLLGESGVGKSTLLRLFSKGMEARRTSEGWTRPLVHLVVPTAPTAISMFEAMLAALQDPRPSRGTRSQKKERLIKMLHEQCVRLLFLDDLQHFVDRESDRVLFDASEALKEVLILYPMSVVCAGLRDAERVVRSNEQLKRRHMRTVKMSRFNWNDSRSRRAFTGVLRAFAKTLDCFEMPEMASSEIALRFFLATGGIMDFIAKIFICTASLAQARDVRVITIEMLAEAWDIVLFHAGDDTGNPFLRDIDTEGDKQIVRALAINHEVPNTTVRRKKAKTRLSEVGL